MEDVLNAGEDEVIGGRQGHRGLVGNHVNVSQMRVARVSHNQTAV